MIGRCTGELCAEGDKSGPHTVDCSGMSADTIHVTQILWPDHCVIDRSDALFNSKLEVLSTDLVVRKGYRCHARVSVHHWLSFVWHATVTLTLSVPHFSDCSKNESTKSFKTILV